MKVLKQFAMVVVFSAILGNAPSSFGGNMPIVIVPPPPQAAPPLTAATEAPTAAEMLAILLASLIPVLAKG